MSEVDRVKTESSDDSQARPSVFRRVMARDLYDLKKRLDVLEQDSEPAPEPPEKMWSYVIPALILLPLFVGAYLYFGHRIDSVDELQHEETDALRSEIELRQYMIDELHQIVRQQANAQRAIVAAQTATENDVVTAADQTEAEGATANNEPSEQGDRDESLPSALAAGEVLLIVASTAIKEEALELAQALERDGHASEVVLGLIGYYGVALGRFDFEQAESLRTSMIESAPDDPAPYLMPQRMIDSFVYP
ncbi:MAG: hypothetical protein ACR2QQ_00420 [Gammaproteobacteria bacterium]